MKSPNQPFLFLFFFFLNPPCCCRLSFLPSALSLDNFPKKKVKLMWPFPPFDNQATKLKNQNHKLLLSLPISALSQPFDANLAPLFSTGNYPLLLLSFSPFSFPPNTHSHGLFIGRRGGFIMQLPAGMA